MKKPKNKIGRNDPCWCGSGKKYKKCHYGRDSMEKQNPFSAEKQLIKNYSKKYCLHPGASEAEKAQCFLLSYRALCRELFTKKAALESVQIYRQADMGQPLNVQIEMQYIVGLNEMALKKSYQELSDRKNKYDKILLSQDYNVFSYYGIFLDTLPEILCSGGFAPEFDFEGNMLQDYLNLEKDLESFYFSLIPYEDAGLALFGWIERQDSSCTKFIKKLHTLYSNGEIGNAIVRFIFDSFENTFFRISWWEGLSKKEKDSLQNRILSGAFSERKNDCLMDDGLRTVNWNVSSVFTNLNLTS